MANEIVRNPLYLVALTMFVAFIHAQESTVPSPEEETIKFNIVRKDSTPSSLFIAWDVPEDYVVATFRVETKKKGSDYIIVGPIVAGPAENCTINDLVTKSEYTVCLYANLTSANISSELPDRRHGECADLKTPPAIRWDSILVLVLVIGSLLFLVLLGYLCWRRDIKKQEAGDDNEEEDTTSPIEEKIENGERQPFLLNSPPPATEKPSSKLEDEDIPFITPTWDQIAKEKGTA